MTDADAKRSKILRVGAAFGTAALLAGACGTSHGRAADPDAAVDGHVIVDAGRFDATQTDAGACAETFSNACVSSSDCAVGWFGDCCGGASAKGIRSADVEAYRMFAERCEPEPTCECVSGLRDEEGQVVQSKDEVIASCVAGQCLAHVRLCEPGVIDCAEGLSCCYPCGAGGCEPECEPTCTDPSCAGGCEPRP